MEKVDGIESTELFTNLMSLLQNISGIFIILHFVYAAILKMPMT